MSKKKKCPYCKNGKIKVKMTITSPWETVNCPDCKGDGVIDEINTNND